MSERIATCPSCGAPAAPPSKWARSTLCAHCGKTVLFDPDAVSVEPFREARRTWEDRLAPAIGAAHFRFGGCIARGARSDVYLGERARFPTERVAVKVLRPDGDPTALDREWSALRAMADAGTLSFPDRVPIALLRGAIQGGLLDGRSAIVFRWSPGFVRSLAQARALVPRGLPAITAPWIWRRALEVLAAIHRLGWAHGDVSPEHLVFHENEHGIRIVGFGAARKADDTARATDAILSARAVRAVTEALPPPFGALVDEVSASTPGADVVRDLWALRERVGTLAKTTFGPPSFHPLRIA